MALVLGLHGAAMSGKDTVADYLVDQKGWTAKLSFAHNLKEMCKAIFYLTDHDVHDQAGKHALFAKPKTFTENNLGSVLFWMSRTHARFPVSKESKLKVKSLVGTELRNPRDILQFVGTEICRELIKTYHVDIVKQQVLQNPEGKFVITDVRFPNEGDFVLDDLQGSVIKIERPNLSSTNINRQHASETSMSDWGRFNAVIDNSEVGLEKLYEKVDTIVKRTFQCLEEAEADTQ